jgi:hypothetical protein
MSAPLVAIRPGPVLLVWTGGNEIASIMLDRDTALTLLADLAKELRCAE